jgi:hypothetical protein
VEQDERVADMIRALGPGGTRELAERALAWHGAGTPDYSRLGGLKEVAELVDRSIQGVTYWRKQPKLATPEPLFKLGATPVWDLEHWVAWGVAHDELVGPKFDPFGTGQRLS